MKAAVIGAGWAGLSAAAALKKTGAAVTVFEAGRTPGGRARRVSHPAFKNNLDNGQHILLGAYEQTLALMRQLGRDPDALFLRQRLCLSRLDGSLHIAAPGLPAPFHAAAGLLSARGLSWSERWAALRLMRALQQHDWQASSDWTVAQLLAHYQQPATLVGKIWEPLCLAALNTPLLQASALLFMRVLKDSLTGSRKASDFLLPRIDLSALWTDAATRQCTMRYGSTVRQLKPEHDHVQVNNEHFDTAVLAVPPVIAARLLEGPLQDAGAAALLAALRSFHYFPIATLNLRLAQPWRLPEPMMLLREDPTRGHDGQWLFDRSQISGITSTGELALVISVAQGLAGRDREAGIAALIQQIREQATQLAPMPAIEAAELFIEKRATFAATPALQRPGNATPWPRLVLAGDWTDTGYPGVLEGAVRSGLQAATILSRDAPA